MPLRIRQIVIVTTEKIITLIISIKIERNSKILTIKVTNNIALQMLMTTKMKSTIKEPKNIIVSKKEAVLIIAVAIILILASTKVILGVVSLTKENPIIMSRNTPKIKIKVKV